MDKSSREPAHERSVVDASAYELPEGDIIVCPELDSFLAGRAGGDEADAELLIGFAYTNDSLKVSWQKWPNAMTTWRNWRATLLDYPNWPVRAAKDNAGAFCCGTLIGPKRKAQAFDVVYLLVSDHDDGQTMAESAELAERGGWETVIAPSYNFNSSEVLIKREGYLAWARRNDRPPEITEEFGREYLEFEGMLLPAFARTASFNGAPPVQHEDGFAWSFTTSPREKHRCIRPLAEPVAVSALLVGQTTHKQVLEAYKVGVAEALYTIGGTHDKACHDITRAYYHVCQRPDGSLPRPIHIVGAAFELLPMVQKSLAEGRQDGAKSKNNSRSKSERTKSNSPDSLVNAGAFGPYNIVGWMARAAKTYDIEEALRRRRLVKADRPGGGVGIECFHDLHGCESSTETWARNGDGEQGLTLDCSGASGGCPDISDRAVRLVKYLENGKLTISDLEDPTLQGQPVPLLDVVSPQYVKEAIAALHSGSSPAERDAVFALIARLESESEKSDAVDTMDYALGETASDGTKKRSGKKAELRRGIRKAEATVGKSQKAENESSEALDGRTRFQDWDILDAHGAVAEAVISELDRRNAVDPALFMMGQGPVRLVNDQTTGDKSIQAINKPRLRTVIDKAINFVRKHTTKGGDIYFRHYPCPDAIAEHVFNTTGLPFPVLYGLTNVPYFDADGAMVTEAGYHEPSRRYYYPAADFDLPPVPEHPTDEDVEDAKALLFEAVGDFPFNDGPEINAVLGKGAASYANWLAKLIQTFAREMIDGPCPLYLTQKPKARTGASLLADVFSMIAFGHPAKADTEKTDAAEWQKTIVSLLKAGSPHIFFDNIHKKIDDPTLANCVTQSIYRARLLGGNEMITEPVKCVIEVAGNNVALSDELRWRTGLTRLDAEVENPAERDQAKFKHVPLLPWVKANRAQLVWAVLVLIAAWVSRGKKMWEGKALGAFEAYCAVVGGILDTAGIPGFLENRSLLKESVGDGDGILKSFICVWHAAYGSKEVKVGSLEFAAEADQFKPNEFTDSRVPETLVELLLAHSTSIDLGFNGWTKTGWQKGMGQALTAHKDQVFSLEDGSNVALRYRRSRSGMIAQLEPV